MVQRPNAGSCPSRQYCNRIGSCEEAQWYLANCSWGGALDGDGDGVPCGALCRSGRGLLADGQRVGVADDDQFIGLAQAVAAVFGLELGEFEALFGHLAGFGQGERQLARRAIGEFGGEGGHGDLDRRSSCFVLPCVGVRSREGW